MTDALSAGASLAGSYQWASVTGSHGMATMEELKAQGYVTVAESPRWPGSWLMKREDT